MNLFEDLIEELKSENLLEETVIETRKPLVSANNIYPDSPSNDGLISQTTLDVDITSSQFTFSPTVDDLPSSRVDTIDLSETATSKEILDSITAYDFKIEDQARTPINESEFYRRRATEEVSSLKIVEHILSGVEREHMKISPKTYDDVSVSVALHDFLKVTQSSQSPEHAQSEFKLMQETESWYSSLSYRDKHISVGDLRRYCEKSRPPLSMQALVSMARFYRNSPFSESVRSKFDMVVTRLLTKEIDSHKRELLFGKEELVQQLTGLYSDWSSIPLYAADDDPEVLIATLKFQDFVSEATGAGSLDELIKNDFFNRLRIFKESTGENFFAPLLTATAIESNVAIGNNYVDLVSKAHAGSRVSELEEKYKFLVDQVVSDTTSKTLQIVELLKDKRNETKPTITEVYTGEKEIIPVEMKVEWVDEGYENRRPFLFGINKWIIVVAVVALFLFGGLYTWVEFLTPQIKPSPSVTDFPLENSLFKENYKVAKINHETLFAITLASWDALPKESKEDLLKKTLAVGKEKGFRKVHLINPEGKTIAFASEQGIDIVK